MNRTGKEIVYCSICSSQVRGGDFEKGKAFRLDNHIVCAACRPDLAPVADLPSHPPSRTFPATAGPQSSTQVRKATRIRRRGSRGWIWGGVAAGALVIGVFHLPSLPTPPAEREIPLAREIDRPDPAPGQPTPPAEKAVPLRILEAGELPQEERLGRFLRGARGTEPPGGELEIVKPERQAAPWSVSQPKPSGDPTPPAPPAPSPPASDPYPAEWGQALEPTWARDFQAALTHFPKGAALSPESAGDAALLARVATLHQQALQILSRLPKGQAIALGVREDLGVTRRIEGSFLRLEPGRVVVRSEAKVVEIELGEVLPASFLELLRATRGTAPEVLTSRVACLLEGDLEGGAGAAGDPAARVPERFLAYGRRLHEAQLKPDPVRALYTQALRELGSFETVLQGTERVRGLLRNYPTDPFVLRNKASLVDRAQGGRDFLLWADDLVSSGALHAGKGGKAECFWTLEGDPDPQKPRENYLEAVFPTLPELSYRCWILAGGCCLETFEFSCQGTELQGPAAKGAREPAFPGSGVWLPVHPYISSLKKTHAGHTGPRSPTRWEWVAVPLPKYHVSGTQRLRILFPGKGFGVAAVLVSATRSDPPPDAELRELVRSRTERPRMEVLQPPKVIPIVRCALDGTDQRLVGTLEKGALFGITLYDHCFLGLERNESVRIPSQGELRATYFLKSVTKLSFRLRIQKGPSESVPYDVIVENPVAGVPTEVRFPFSRFKAIYEPGTPSVLPGDETRMIYIFGESVDCGLRLDSLSLVEIRAPEGRGSSERSAAETGVGKAGSGPWKPIFDGRTLEAFTSGIGEAWHVQDGSLLHDNAVDNAAQTHEEFRDGEFRFRFEVRDVSRAFFALRQDGKGQAWKVVLEGPDLIALRGGVHELIISCLGERVAATLDGKARAVEEMGRPYLGRIQFNASAGSFRLFAIDYREFR